MDAVEWSSVDWKGRVFTDYYVDRAPGSGPGWYIWGQNAEYDGRLRFLCGRPAVKARRLKHWNGRVRRGWATKKEAERVLAEITTRDTGPRTITIVPLHGRLR